MDMANDAYTFGKRHNDPNWIIVGASTVSDGIAAYSNYSATYCDLFAPGDNIYSTDLGNEYTTMSGTSFAAPYVTAAAALIMSHATHLTPLEVKSLLMSTVDEGQAFEGKCVSGGRLSIINAVNQLYTENRSAYTLGDLDGNGTVTSSDANIVRQIHMQTIAPTEQQSSAADINGNGRVNLLDYALITQFVNKTAYFPPE
ncbi:MAG: S8 family serine peptidase [Clostridia bacterium]|nr:S8 family serine peptidase [Clostridia bacterium]